MSSSDTQTMNQSDHKPNPDLATFGDDELGEYSLILPPAGCCFHCGEVLPKEPFFTMIFDKPRPMCCLGCQLAAQSIVEAGLSQYYLDRREISPTASLPEAINFDAYNHADIKEQFVYAENGGSTAELSVTNLKCSACTWLIETRLRSLDGVRACQVNLTQQRMRVNWDDGILSIGEILKTVHSVGYDAKPYRQDTHEAMLKRQNQQMLIRLGIAALGAMQAMMFSIGMYFGTYSGILVEHRDFLRYVSLFVSIPVFFYSGVPFFMSAYHALRTRQINMDVPVSIALILTFFASLYATIIGAGETYFDSVSMFIFFLLAGRYIEHNARLKASNMASDLVVIEPILVTKLDEASDLVQALATDQAQAAIETWLATKGDMDKRISQIGQDDNAKILAQSVKVGDVIWIESGCQIVADGVLLSKTATVSQSLLTGESDLIVKTRGERLAGGSQNDSQPLLMLVTDDVDNSQIALIDRLMNRAMSEKPQIAQDADKMARWFVARVLLLSLLVFVVWYFIDKTQALWATVAVLVATCPCALSLATPIALTVATNRLASFGFLPTRGHTVQTLAKVSHVAFDKTGTLTLGQANLLAVVSDYPDGDILALAAALEIGSRHPVAKAILTAAHGLHLPAVQEMSHHIAGGVEAVSQGVRYRIGHASFVTDQASSQPDFDYGRYQENLEDYQANMSVLLSAWQDGSWRLIARFYFNDPIRTDAHQMIEQIKSSGMIPLMLTGDPNPNALKVAKTLGIDQAYYGLTPEDKVSYIKQLQQDNHIVLMVGDGINDAPVLAAANVSTAIAGAADLAQVSSDSVLLGGRLHSIPKVIHLSIKTQAIIRQNLKWALVYNALVLLPAAFGYVPPWLAAIGMSLSSLVVVSNAMRIKKTK